MDLIHKIFILLGKKIQKKLLFLFLVLFVITITELLSLGLIIPLIKALIEDNQNFIFFEYLKKIKFINSENLISWTFLIILTVYFLKYIISTFFIFVKSKI